LSTSDYNNGSDPRNGENPPLGAGGLSTSEFRMRILNLIAFKSE